MMFVGRATTVENLPVLRLWRDGTGLVQGAIASTLNGHGLWQGVRERRVELIAVSLRDHLTGTEQPHLGVVGLGLVGGPQTRASYETSGVPADSHADMQTMSRNMSRTMQILG
jgi:hypothetical protein